MFQPGDLLAGRYVIQNVSLGAADAPTAGFACSAIDSLTSEKVVCKLPLEGSAGYDELLRDQYAKLRRIRSAHVVRPHTMFEHKWDGSAVPVLVMELVEGMSIASWASNQPKRERIRALIAVCDGLGSLEEVGLSHGDLHAGNVLVTTANQVVLIDPDGEFLGGAATGVGDRGTLRTLIEQILPDVPLPSVLATLTANESSSPAALAATLRSLLGASALPGELGTGLDEIAARAKDDTASRRRTYDRLVQARELALRALSDRLRTPANAFGLSVDEQLTLESPADPHSGCLRPRFLKYTNEEADVLTFQFSGKQSFRRPWPFPERPGLADAGTCIFIRNGTVSAKESVEVFWDPMGQDDAIVVDGGGRPITDDIIERWFAILVGEVYPAVTDPVRSSGSKASPPSLALLLTQDDLRAALGEAEPDILSDARFRRAEREAVRQFLNGDLVGSATGKRSDLREFMKQPLPTRQDLANRVGEQVLGFLDPYVDEIRRLDIRVKDPGRRIVEVSLELRRRGSTVPVAWSFDISCS